MKLNKLIYTSLIAVILSVTACKNGFEEINKPWDKDVAAPVEQLYNGLVSTLVLGWQEQVTYHTWIYPITQQAVTTSNSGYVLANAASELWSNYYLALGNFRLLEKRIEESPNKDKYKNLQAMAKTIMAYKTLKVSEFFGAMPYTEAGRAATEGAAAYRAKYDSQADVFKSALAELKWAVDNFSTSADQISIGGYETFLKGDITQWTKFANSLRLRYALTMSAKDAATATPIITEALAKPLLADGENIAIWPKALNLTLDGRRWSFNSGLFHRMGTTMWSYMSSNDNKDGSGIFDPRCKIFFEPNNAGQWAPYPQNPTTATVGEGGLPYDNIRLTSWATKGAGNLYSPLNYYFAQDQTTIPEPIFTAAEIHFLKAEIYTSGIGATKNLTTAKGEYEKGVTASVNFWTKVAMDSPEWVVSKPTALPSAATITALLTNAKVAFDATNEANALKQIYAQMWVDGFRQPWDVWALKRRTGNLTPMTTVNSAYYDSNFGIYHRLVYPSSEADYNSANWRTATGGADLTSTKTWLEK
ncbi:SusD/RagB family nutrient-binding outer membrane lipoprotein [Dyadobacter psychrotolerans]|nr:SusD/RagB family nutrient-binding outer membrane lipoprotein [Dyadobacter psychrotolerans]